MAVELKLSQFLPAGTALTDLTDEQLADCNGRIAAVMKQLQEMQTAVRKEGIRREVAAIDAKITVWTNLYKFIVGADPKLKKAKQNVGARTNRLNDLKEQLAVQVAKKEAMMVEDLTLRCHRVFYGFLGMLNEGLQTAILKNITFTDGPAIWSLRLPFAAMTHLHIEGVSARVELAAFRRMAQLVKLTIKNPCKGQLRDLGTKPRLTTLRINIFAMQGESAEVTDSLGKLNGLPLLPQITNLELVNCGLEGDIRDLNRVAKTVELVDIGFNPGIAGKAHGLESFPKLRRFIATRCHIMDVWDNFHAWMRCQPQLTQVYVEGVPMFGDRAKKYVAAQFVSSEDAAQVEKAVAGQRVPEVEKHFVPMDDQMHQLVQIVEGAVKAADSTKADPDAAAGD